MKIVLIERDFADGKFSAKSLPGGDYRLVAVSDVAPDQWYDVAFLRSLVSLSTPVTLPQGNRRDQALRIAR